VRAEQREPRGRAVQVDPMEPMLKPPGTEHMKLNCGILLSTVAFKCYLRRYSACAARDFTCDELCGAPLRCGAHFCQSACHQGRVLNPKP